MMKRVVTTLLSVLLTCSFVACTDNDSSSSDSSTSSSSIESVEKNDALVYNGETDYKIVLSSMRENNNDFVAASEMNTLVSEATGVSFPIVYDDQVTDADSGKFISIGHTVLSRATSIEIDNNALYRSGFVSKTIGDDLYLLGSTDKYSFGSVYAVYDYLHEILNYEFYAKTCYTLDKVLAVRFKEIDKVEIPDIGTRAISFSTLRQDSDYARRLRLESGAAQPLWIASGHSIDDLAKASTYLASNPDWFSADGKGHCFSNDGLRDHLIESLKRRIEANIDSPAFLVQVGQADTSSFCNCQTCENEVAEKYMTRGGQLIGLINEISDAITPWLTLNYPDKEILFTTFAYMYSENPPVVVNEETGEIEPFSEHVVPRKNVGVYWAPIGMDYSKPIYDESIGVNQASMAALEGWKILTDEIYMWSYCCNFSQYQVFYDNFGSIAENYRTYAQYGVKLIFDQGYDGTGTANFEELRAYVQSKLMWDTSLDIQVLIDDFMVHYYGVANAEVKDFFNQLRSYYAYLQSKTLMVGTIYYNTSKAELWPIGMLNGFAMGLDNALEKIDSADLSGAEKEEYTNRVNRLYCMIYFLYFKHYQGYFTDSQLSEMRAVYEKTCELYGITQGSEGGAL